MCVSRDETQDTCPQRDRVSQACGPIVPMLPSAQRLGGGAAQMETVRAGQWKSDLHLNGTGKEGSRALANALFPAAAPLLRCARTLSAARRMCARPACGAASRSLGPLQRWTGHASTGTPVLLHTTTAPVCSTNVLPWIGPTPSTGVPGGRRKKDHGRAEAMLIAAWGLGLRLTAESSAPLPQHVPCHMPSALVCLTGVPDKFTLGLAAWRRPCVGQQRMARCRCGAGAAGRRGERQRGGGGRRGGRRGRPAGRPRLAAGRGAGGGGGCSGRGADGRGEPGGAVCGGGTGERPAAGSRRQPRGRRCSRSARPGG